MSKGKRVWATGIAVVLMAGMLTGCGGTNSGSGGATGCESETGKAVPGYTLKTIRIQCHVKLLINTSPSGIPMISFQDRYLFKARISSSRSTGFDKCAFMPASSVLLISSSKVSAVIAIIGMVGASFFGNARIFFRSG